MEEEKMKLKWIGAYEKIDTFPETYLPEDSVCLSGSADTDMENFSRSSLIFFIPVLLLCAAVGAGKWLVWGDADAGMNREHLVYLAALGTGQVLSLCCIPIHELLHAIVYPRNALVLFGYLSESGGLFITSTEKLRRNRYLVMVLLPFLVLGLLPLLLYLCIPPSLLFLATAVFCFASFSCLFCIGDFYQFFETLKKTPRGAIIQNSGNKTWWYREVPDERPGEMI